MKKTFSLFIAVMFIAVTLAGCGKSATPENIGPNDKLSVVATIFAPYDFARAITGDKAVVSMLLPPASESHSYEPSPQDIIKIQNCDVFIYVGGESDEWVNDVLDSMDLKKVKLVTLMDCVEAVEEKIIEGMEDGGHAEQKDVKEPEYDEHVWTSPKNAKLIIQKIAGAFVEADAANTDIYNINAKAYLAKLDELDAEFQNVVGNAARKTIVFGDRFPFRYLADAYGLTYFAAFPGCSSETEASAATVAFLIDKIRSENIPVIFHIELSNEKLAETISEATGAKVLLLHSCHNIAKSDFESGKTYIELMNGNIAALKDALSTLR